MEYTVLQTSFDRTLNPEPLNKLISMVNEKIKDGWEPLGGVCRSDDENHEWFLQAMIKR